VIKWLLLGGAAFYLFSNKRGTSVPATLPLDAAAMPGFDQSPKKTGVLGKISSGATKVISFSDRTSNAVSSALGSQPVKSIAAATGTTGVVTGLQKVGSVSSSVKSGAKSVLKKFF
jgi:hypothetical protein